MENSGDKEFAEKALFAQSQGQLQKAISYYQQALKLRPQWPEVYYNLGIIFEQQQDLLKAIECYKQATLQKPNYAEAYYNLGVVYQKLGLIEAAIETYQKTIELAPQLIVAYNNLGCLWIEIEEYSQAIDIFKKALHLNFEQPEIYNNLGEAYLKNGNIDAAIANYLQTIKIQPNFMKAYENLGRIFYQNNLFSVALQYLQEGLKIQPDSISLQSQCVTVLIAQNQLEKAIIYLQKIVALEKIWISSYCQRSKQFNTEDIMDQATIACCQLLGELQKNKPEINSVKKYLAQTYLHLANILVKYRNYPNAERYYQQAIEIEPKLTEAYMNWGNCLEKQWRFNAAALQYHKALSQQPDHTELYQKVSEVLEKQQQVEQGKLIFKSAKERYQLKLPTSVTKTPDPNQPKCQGLDCKPCLKRIRQQFKPQLIAPRIEQYFYPESLLENSPNSTVKIIPEGRAWVAPKTSWWNVCNAIAIFNSDNELIPELSQFYPTPLPGCKNYDWSQHQVFSLDELPPLKVIQGRVAVLSGLSGNVYFHWMVDILPRIKILQDNNIDLNTIDWFLINSNQQRFQRETLEKIGIPGDKIIESDQVSYLQASSLIVPSYPASVGWVVPNTIKFLRSLFLTDVLAQKQSSPKRIYISRNQARYRRLLNEGEILEYLSQWGFVSIELETLTVQQQAHLFSQAEVIIAPHGAGLTNLVFCQPNTVVVELVSPHYIRPYYWLITQQLGLKHYSIQGEALGCSFLRQLLYPTPLVEDLQINVKSLETLLQFSDILQDIDQSNNSSCDTRPMISSSNLDITVLENGLQKAKEHLTQKNFEEAILACKKVLKIDLNCAEAYTILGNALQLQGNFAQAQASYEKAIQLQPDLPEPLGNLGSLYAKQQQWELAVEYYQKALTYKPDCEKLYRNLAKVLTPLNRTLEATECWYQSYRLQPEQALDTEHLELGKKLLEQGQDSKAIACFQTAISLSQNSELSLQTKQEAYSLMAKALYHSNQLEAALQSYQELLKLNPQDAIAYTNLGNLYAKRQEWKSAIVAYQNAIALNPNLAIAYRHLGQVFQQLGNQDQAIEYWYQGFNIEPTAFSATDHLALGHLLWQKGLLQPATTCYRHALECDPTNAIAYHNLGEVLVAQGQLEAAIDAYHHAIELNPSFETYNSLGKVLGQQGRWQEVIACYRRAMELNPRLLMAMQTLTQALAYNQTHQGQGESPPLFSRMVAEVLCWQPQIGGTQPQQLREIEPETSVSVSYTTIVPSVNLHKVQRLLEQAEVYTQEKRWKDAMSCYENALQIQPDNPDIHALLGDLYAEQEEWDNAIQSYQTALQFNPDFISVHEALGDIGLSQGQWYFAIQYYQNVLALDPQLQRIYQKLGDALWEVKEINAAIDAYRKATEL